MSYNTQVVWHYYEITFTGTVNVSLYLDNVLLVGDGDDAVSTTDKKTLVTTKTQETTKVYLPALSYGRVPHVLNDITDAGQVLSWRPVALPARFYNTLEGVSEAQITYKDQVFVDLFIDGEKSGDTYQFEAEYDSLGNMIYTTKKFYVEGQTIGRVFQYIQSGGVGDVATFETDAHVVDEEQPRVTEPERRGG